MSSNIVNKTIKIILGCIIALVIGEIILRISGIWIGRHSDTMFSVIDYDELLGWKLKSNIKKEVDFVDVEGIQVKTNTSGFWDDEFKKRKNIDSCRIAFLGDSFTWGMGVNEIERFSEIIEHYDSNWECFNFGIPGYGTDQSLLVWKNIAKEYDPDVVVLTIYQNDFSDNLHSIRYGRPKPYYEIIGEKIILNNVPVQNNDFWDNGIYNQIASPYKDLYDISEYRRNRAIHFLAKNSDITRFIYTYFIRDKVERPNLFVNKDTEESDINLTTQLSQKKLSELELKQIDLMTAIIKEFNNNVKESGAKFIVVFTGDLIAQTLYQIQIFHELEIRYIDATTEKLDELKSNPEQPVYYPYNKHWTSSTHRTVAKLISSYILENNFCPANIVKINNTFH